MASSVNSTGANGVITLLSTAIDSATPGVAMTVVMTPPSLAASLTGRSLVTVVTT